MTNETRLPFEITQKSDQDSPEARAERLKRLRNMANLTRKQLCEKSGVNINTYIGYEVARYGGLTRWGAEKIINQLAREGVQCNLNWLMHNVGSGPVVSVDYKEILEAIPLLQEPTTFDREEELIVEELLLFRRQYKQAIDYIVDDDAMLPYYVLGEYLAGIKHYKESIKSAIEQDCIVQTREGKTLFRRLHQGNEPNLYTLSCLNPQTTVPLPILHNIELVSAAPVVWRRRKIIKV
jgi:HTH-type transcriptional regulator, cell division transcriptional repressor